MKCINNGTPEPVGIVDGLLKSIHLFLSSLDMKVKVDNLMCQNMQTSAIISHYFMCM